MSTAVFTNLQVYPQLKDLTLVEFDIHSDFRLVAGFNFDVQVSRDPEAEDADWTVIDSFDSLESGYPLIIVNDEVQRSWSTEEQWFYRVKLTNGDDAVYYSCVEPAQGSFDRNDRLKAREIFRQELLRFSKFGGSKGLLFRRKHWGVRATGGLVLDQVTNEVLDPYDLSDYGTGFVGGYWKPVEYWVGFDAGNLRSTTQSEVGTVNATEVKVRALAWPIPRSRDFWYDCTSGKRYIIESSVNVSIIRHTPIVLMTTMHEAPTTDIIHQVPLD